MGLEDLQEDIFEDGLDNDLKGVWGNSEITK
jgi:hypothetical protein